MTKWEYLFLDSAWDLRCGHVPISVNRKKLHFDGEVCVDDYSNRLGAEGWELVGIIEPGNVMRLVFKRPKEE